MNDVIVVKRTADDFLNFIDLHFALICTNCKRKVLDPEKRKGQIHFKGKCPSCGENSQEQKHKKSKRERKRERREAQEAARLARGRIRA